MPQGRPSIPAELERRVLIEAGHRCAIPTCRAHPVEIDHIDDWAKVKKHQFENLIALCPTCHARKGDKPGQIDRKSLRIYKANLGMLNARYGEVERRLLEYFGATYCEDPETWERVKREGGAAESARRKLPELGSSWLDLTLAQGIPLVAILPIGQEFLVSYLIKDGHLVRLPVPEFGLRMARITVFEAYALTETGMHLVEQLVQGQPLA